MCNLLGHVADSLASLFVRRWRGRRRGGVEGEPASGPRSSRETARSTAVARPESASSNRGTKSYAASHTRNDDAPRRSQSLSLSQSGVPNDPRVDVQQHSRKRRSTASLTKDRESVYPKRAEAKDERPQSATPEGEDQHPHDEDRDPPRWLRRPSEKDPIDVHHPPYPHVPPIVPSSTSLPRLFETQSRELSILQHEHRAALQEKKALTDAYAGLRQQYDERCRKLNVVRHECQALLDQRKEIDEAHAALKRQYDEQAKKLHAVRHERLAVLEQKKQADEDVAALQQKSEAQQGEYEALSNKYQSLKAVLEQRTSELQGVQRFLTVKDTYSGSEVVNALRKLNEEAHRCTTFMAEWVVENLGFETPDQTPNIEQTRTLDTLGVRFMQLLGTKKHKDNPILMEMALRAYLTYELYWVASPWSIGQEEQAHNMYVDAIYQRIREEEGEAVSGNWRALMRAHTMPACISDPEIAHTFDTTIIAGFSDIVLAAGCTGTKSDVTSALWTEFAEKIHHFVSLAGQVNKMIGVGVVSEDFEVLVIWPDVPFDDRAMEDAYDNGDRAASQDTEEECENTVLCATELGLMQRMKVGPSSRHKSRPSELIVIKPKIALVSVIDMIE